MTAREAPPYKVAIDLAHRFIQFGHELGLPVEEAMTRHGLEITPLPDQPAYMAGPAFEKLMGIGLHLMQDPLPGLASAQRKVATVFGLAGFLVQTSSTVGVMLDTMIRVEPLLGDSGLTRLHHEGDSVRVVWDTRFIDPFVRHHTADFILAGYAWAVMTASRPGQRNIREVHFQHEAPADTLQLRRYLTHFGCPVYFGQPANELVLPRAAFDLPLPSADPALFEVLEQHARKLLEERRNAPSLVDLARSRLHSLLQRGEASRERLADELGITGRTLHRKLQEAGTSYRDLLDELRLERARTLLRGGGLGIQAVAERAGFDESASFTRWFKALTGLTPSEFRQGLLRPAE